MMLQCTHSSYIILSLQNCSIASSELDVAAVRSFAGVLRKYAPSDRIRDIVGMQHAFEDTVDAIAGEGL